MIFDSISITRLSRNMADIKGNMNGLIKMEAGSIVEKFTFLKMLFNKAVEWGYIEKNPCSKATKPKRISRKTINYYNEEQVKKLLKIIPCSISNTNYTL